MARRTKEEAQETRNRILDTAEAVFHEKGVSRTTLGDIAAAAGVTRGAIYWHFKNKVDLFHAMLERVCLPIEDVALRAGDASLTDPLSYIRNCALAVLTKTANDPQARRVFDIVCHKCELVDDMSPARDRYIEGRSACLDQMETGFKHAVALGQLSQSVNPRRAAVTLHALIDGLIANWTLQPDYFPLAEEAEQVVNQFMQGLKLSCSQPDKH